MQSKSATLQANSPGLSTSPKDRKQKNGKLKLKCTNCDKINQYIMWNMYMYLCTCTFYMGR